MITQTFADFEKTCRKSDKYPAMQIYFVRSDEIEAFDTLNGPQAAVTHLHQTEGPRLVRRKATNFDVRAGDMIVIGRKSDDTCHRFILVKDVGGHMRPGTILITIDLAATLTFVP